MPRLFLLSLLVVSVFTNAVVADAKPVIDVVYPSQGQRIGAVDSTFIHGNVTPGATLTINGHMVDVHKNGAWLAYLPIEQGDFVFRLLAQRDGDSTILELPVRVPEPYRIPAADSLVILKKYQSPARRIGLMDGDILNLSFRGSAGQYAYFTLSTDERIFQMTESPPAVQAYWGADLFGGGDIPDSLLLRGIYTGAVSLDKRHASAITQVQYVLCRDSLTVSDQTDPLFESALTDCGCVTDTNGKELSVMDANEIIIGELVDPTQTIRTGPCKGYLSIFQPKGLKFRITGYYNNYLRAQLVPGQPCWIPDSSITILPTGTQLPHGTVVLIRTDKTNNGVIVSMNCAAQLPFRVEEDVSNDRLVLDIYNCTSNIDWIRYDNSDDLISLIRWSQAQEGVLRLTIDLREAIWGYDTWYQGTTFKLKLRQAPNLKWGLKDVRIVIDPGHSPDPGAIGPTRLTEAEANLGIALELAEILRKKKVKVMLTRSDDSPLPIYDRPKIAQKFNADIFISIHNNALPDGVNPFVNNGVSTYYYHPHARQLADYVQRSLAGKTKYPDFGTYHANFAVTRPTGYLAILVECAFMILPEHEMALRKHSFRKRVATGIADGVMKFIKDVKKRQANLSRHRR